MKHSYNQKTGKYYSKLIRNVNIYLNENQEKVWNEFNDFTYSQRIEYLINFYIKHNKIDKEGNIIVKNYVNCKCKCNKSIN